MEAKIQKVNRPKYFISNDVCVRIDNIVFVHKSNDVPYGSDSKDTTCCIEIGVTGTQVMCVPILCKDLMEQNTIYTQLTTILQAL